MQEHKINVYVNCSPKYWKAAERNLGAWGIGAGQQTHSALLSGTSKLCQNDYATKGALYISTQLSTDVVQKIWVLIRLWKHTRKLETHPPQGKKKFLLNSNDFVFICDSVSNMVSYKRNVWYNLSCLLQTYCCLSIIKKKLCYLAVFQDLWCVINYDGGWRKAVFNKEGPYFKPGVYYSPIRLS